MPGAITVRDGVLYWLDASTAAVLRMPVAGGTPETLATARGFGVSAIAVIREAVAEVEDTWAKQLGPKRLAQLRNLLRDLNELQAAELGSHFRPRHSFAAQVDQAAFVRAQSFTEAAQQLLSGNRRIGSRPRINSMVRSIEALR